MDNSSAFRLCGAMSGNDLGISDVDFAKESFHCNFMTEVDSQGGSLSHFVLTRIEKVIDDG